MNDFTSTPNASFGQHLKRLRTLKNLSQLALAHAAETTARHVSFIETGRSRPGRDLVLRLSDALSLSPRQINVLLGAAGLPVAFAERELASDCSQSYSHAVRLILDRHDPYPACALDRLGQVVMHNKAFATFSPQLIGRSASQLMEDFLGEGPSSDFVLNWAEIAWNWVDRLGADYATTADPEIGALYERAMVLLADVARPAFQDDAAVLTVQLKFGDQILRTFATVMRFESAREVTLSELKVELIFPEDEATAKFFESLAAPNPT